MEVLRLTEVPCSDKLEWQPYDSLRVRLDMLSRQKETSSDSNTCKYCLDNLLALFLFRQTTSPPQAPEPALPRGQQ